MELLNRLCELQKEYRELYTGGERVVVGITPTSVQVTADYFFKTFNEFNIREFGEEYMKASVVHEEIEFMTLLEKNEKEAV